MLKIYRLQDGKVVEAASGEAQILMYVNPDDIEKNYLINTLLLDEHTLNSSLDPNELGRLEFETNHMAVISKRPRRYSSKDNFLLKVDSVGLFLFADKLVMVTREEFPFEGRIFARLRSLQDVFIKVVFTLIRHFEEHLLVIHSISDELEAEINMSMSNKNLIYMFNLEKSLVYYLNAINSNSKVIEKLKMNSVKIGFNPDVVEFLEDVIIENAQCYEQANTYSQVLSSLMDARASIISNNLNIRIKMLTILSLCIMLPTLIVSLFSMNMPLPLPFKDTLIPFWIVVGLAGLSIVAIVLAWRLRKW
ncbi:MAG: magnesium transporter CorA family protein [Candidatus Omnitrophica bacterium]|nr:magnesium transporter CorA family protein [Candidatus Omnitrophota bacterium]